MSLQFPAADIITVPGEMTSSSLYFCFMDKESFPVGTLIPKSMEKSETSFTAAYKRASSPSLFAGHIQFAERETLFKPSFNGRSEEHTSELQSRPHLVCRLLLEKKKINRAACAEHRQ